MENAQDCVGEGRAPSRSYNPVAALFFVAYIVVVAFFMLNVFVGYVITTFRYDSLHGPVPEMFMH